MLDSIQLLIGFAQELKKVLIPSGIPRKYLSMFLKLFDTATLTGLMGLLLL
jgi:hypothetical protein